MNCMEAQEMITAFVNDRLDIVELTAFLDHIKGCENCHEELEVYYTLLTAMQQLDQDKDLSNNYRDELNKKIEYWEDKIRRQRMQKFRRRFVFLFMIIGIGMLFGIEIGEKIAEDLEVKEIIREEPSFILSYSGVPEIMDYTAAFIEKHDSSAKMYVSRKVRVKTQIWHTLNRELNDNRFIFIKRKEGE